MHTGRSLTVCRVSLPGGSPCQWGKGSRCQRGSPCQGGLPAGGSPCQVASLLGGSPCQGGSPCLGGSLLGVSLRGGFSLPETPPVDRIIDTSKNITLATTSLRPVIRYFKYSNQFQLMDMKSLACARQSVRIQL